MLVDTALELLGERNRYIILWYIIVNFLRTSASCFAILSFVWANAKPRVFHCKIPDGLLLNESVPLELKEGKQTLSKCRQFLNFSASTNKTVPCQLGYYYESYMEASVITDWDLICDREYLGALADSSFFILSVLASSVFTAIADRFGRKIIFIICLLLMSLLGFFNTLAPNVYIYIVIRLLIGPLQQGTYTVGFCYSLEFFPKMRRATPALLSELFWVLGSLILCLIAYLVKNWKVYYYVTTIPFGAAILLFWFMPESIPWLAAKGRYEEAKTILLKAAQYSKESVSISEQINNETLENEAPNATASVQQENINEHIYPCYFTCIKKHLKGWTVINCVIWFTIGCSYYAFQIYGTNFGNVYINFFLLAIIEAPSMIGASLISKKFGRRLVVSSGYWCTATIILMLLLVMTYASSITELNIFLVVVGRFFSSLVFTMLFLYTGEMFPTSLRTMGVALGTSSARFGVALTPFINMLYNVISWLPTVIIITLCYVAGFLTLFLPETRRWPLPQTLEDVYSWREEPDYQEKICCCKHPRNGHEKYEMK